MNHERLNSVLLKNVYLHVTQACNLHCAHCYLSAGSPQPDELSREEFSALWPDLVALRPEKVVFTGGEPLLRPDILELLHGLREMDREHHIRLCLNTNGYFITPELARDLVGLVDEVRISLDALREGNDVLRGKGSFDAAVRAVDNCCAAGFEPRVSITALSRSLPDLAELFAFLTRRNVHRIQVNCFHPVGRGREHHDWHVGTAEVRAAVDRAWKEVFPSLSTEPDTQLPGGQCSCGVGSFLNVMPNGDVFPCHVLTGPEFMCGNVRCQGLSEICSRWLLGRLQTLDFRQLASQDQLLAPLVCRGTCLGDVYATTKTSPVWAKDLFTETALPALRDASLSHEQKGSERTL
jgi:radical SAM protein with 4Fe4S-binding SPASM domain